VDFRKIFSRRPRITRLTEDSVQKDLEAWRIITAHNPVLGETAIFRIRMSRPARADLITLTSAIVIQWPYEPASGMPPKPVNQQHLDFERALDPLSCENDNSELVQVTTGGGLKEWIYYARSRELFMARMNELLEAHPPYPLQIEFYDDPKWEVWGDTVRSLQAKEG
jgi:hypothetical protein